MREYMGVISDMNEDEFYRKVKWPLMIAFPWGFKDATLISILDRPFGPKYIFQLTYWNPES